MVHGTNSPGYHRDAIDVEEVQMGRGLGLELEVVIQNSQIQSGVSVSLVWHRFYEVKVVFMRCRTYIYIYIYCFFAKKENSTRE